MTAAGSNAELINYLQSGCHITLATHTFYCIKSYYRYVIYIW